jgi:hypothetical protein
MGQDPFLSYGGNYGRLIVHRHTPPATRWHAHLRSNRVNLDTGVVYGGLLTAAIFDEAEVRPIAFLAADRRLPVADASTNRRPRLCCFDVSRNRSQEEVPREKPG